MLTPFAESKQTPHPKCATVWSAVRALISSSSPMSCSGRLSHFPFQTNAVESIKRADNGKESREHSGKLCVNCLNINHFLYLKLLNLKQCSYSCHMLQTSQAEFSNQSKMICNGYVLCLVKIGMNTLNMLIRKSLGFL